MYSALQTYTVCQQASKTEGNGHPHLHHTEMSALTDGYSCEYSYFKHPLYASQCDMEERETWEQRDHINKGS